ncbi:glycosyltransferase family 39 protein [Pontimonas sp.]|nr:hypothetical protein [Pontimonas sp.]MDA8862997.1 glycosyltransferase family 39 protein [Pontimonas sp.]
MTVVGAQLLFIASALAYVVWQNNFLSEEWWVLQLRDIDDMVMNGATEDMRGYLLSGNWGRVASFFGYGYGAGFYLLMAILTSPAHMLDSPQLQIITGRNFSLLAVFLTSLVVALIGRRLFPEQKSLWVASLALGLVTPISLIDATKMHVNGWSTFFGAVAVYLLLHQNRLSVPILYVSSVLMGAAIGFKLTALALLPIFLVVAFFRSREIVRAQYGAAIATIPFSAALFGAPILFAFPVHPQGVEEVLGPLTSVVAAGSGMSRGVFSNLVEALGFYGNPLIVLGLWVLTALLAVKAKSDSTDQLARILPIAVAVTSLVVWFGGAILVDKTAIYLATYTLSVSTFLPIGIFSLGFFFRHTPTQLIVSWIVVFLNLFWSPQFEGTVLEKQNYAHVAASPDVDRKIRAATIMTSVLGEVTEGTRVIVDYSAVFPMSFIDGSVSLAYNYGNLETRVSSDPPYDYIVLDELSYFGEVNEIEDEHRFLLREEGRFGSSRYHRIFSDLGIEVYRLQD